MSTDKIRQLEKQYESLDIQIQATEKSGVYENGHLSNLKNQKLQVKDQLSYLRRQSWTDSQTVNLDE